MAANTRYKRRKTGFGFLDKHMSTRKITPIHYEKLIRLFELVEVKRKKGDHILMTKAGINRPLVIKASPKNVPITHIRTNMTTAGTSRERYFELLDLIS